MHRNLLKKLENERASYSKGQRAIADYFLENYDKAAYITAAAIGKEVGVSESTVVRFATELGFKGYPELQKALREIVRVNFNSLQRMQLTNTIIGDGDPISKVFSSDIDKIQKTLDEIDREAFERAVNKLLFANNIYIIGARSSSFLAGFLEYNLRMLLNNVRLVQIGTGGEVFEQLIPVNENDVVFAISFPRYSSRVVNGVRYAKDKGAQIIALTDGVGSPIAQNATELLIAKSDMISFMDSLSAPLSIINAILVEIVRKKQGECEARFAQLEEIWDKYDVYDKN